MLNTLDKDNHFSPENKNTRSRPTMLELIKSLAHYPPIKYRLTRT